MPNPVVSVSSSASPMPLISGEEIIFRNRPNFIISLFLMVLLILVGGALIFILMNYGALDKLPFISPMTFILIFAGAILFVDLAIFLTWLNTEYILTSKRVEWRFGIIGEKTISIVLTNIESISLKQSIVGRIFNYGDITIEPAGISTTINFNGISNPKDKKDQIEEAASI